MQVFGEKIRVSQNIQHSPSEAPARLRNMKVGFVMSTLIERGMSRSAIPNPGRVTTDVPEPRYASDTRCARNLAAPK